MFETQNCMRSVGHFFRPLHARRDHIFYNTFREFSDIIFVFLPQMFQTSLAWWLKPFIRNLTLCHCGQVGTAASKAPDGSQRVALEWVLRKMPETASSFTSSLFIKMAFQQMCFYLYPQPKPSPPCIGEGWCGMQGGFAGSGFRADVCSGISWEYLLVWPQPWFVLAWHYLFSTIQK